MTFHHDDTVVHDLAKPVGPDRVLGVGSQQQHIAKITLLSGIELAVVG
jgi:hypothetical protein